MPYFSCSQFLAAATYYVAPGGSDDGTRRHRPTLGHRLPGRLQAPNQATWSSFGTEFTGPAGSAGGFPVRIAKAGSPSAWIVLKAEHKWGATLDCGSGAAACSGYVYLDTGAAYWVFQDLVFQHGSNFGMKPNRLRPPTTSWYAAAGSSISASVRTTRSTARRGSDVGDGSSNFTFDGNVFHDIGRTSGMYLSNDHGLYLHAAGVSVVNNIFYAPISGWAANSGRLFRVNRLQHIRFSDAEQRRADHPLGNNFDLTIRDNIFYNPGGAIAINTARSMSPAVAR